MAEEYDPDKDIAIAGDSEVQAHGSITTSKNIQGETDFSPLLIVNIRSADGVWVKANYFLDIGSDSTLVSKRFVKRLGLPSHASSILKFGTAGGQVHEEYSQEYNLEVKPIGWDKPTYQLTAA